MTTFQIIVLICLICAAISLWVVVSHRGKMDASDIFLSLVLGPFLIIGTLFFMGFASLMAEMMKITLWERKPKKENPRP